MHRYHRLGRLPSPGLDQSVERLHHPMTMQQPTPGAGLDERHEGDVEITEMDEATRQPVLSAGVGDVGDYPRRRITRVSKGLRQGRVGAVQRTHEAS